MFVRSFPHTEAAAPGLPGSTRVPLSYHVAFGTFVVSLLMLARVHPMAYEALVQEDRALEWWTVAAYLIAGVVRLRHAIASRRVFDALVALFCLFVAGEEMSWGQRLLGFTPAEVFLAGNVQQEATLHNFASVFGRPKWILMLCLFGYGIALPLVAVVPRLRLLLTRVGATAPSAPFAPWFALAIALLLWYPVSFTGEWVEALAAGLFLASATLSPIRVVVTSSVAVPVALALTLLSAWRRDVNPARVACAQAEAEALLQDLLVHHAASPRLARVGAVHKRVSSAVKAGYVDWNRARGFREIRCEHDGSAATARRRHAIDPWGSAYWLRADRPLDGQRRITLYSFGPNRRRDVGGGITDDVSAVGTQRVTKQLARDSHQR